LGFEKEEFNKLKEEIEYFEGNGRDYVIFDTTDLRAAPEEQLRELCFRTGISFSPEMLQWGKKPVDFHTEQTQQFEKLWYDTLFSSSRVNPPVEIPPVISMFPKFAQDYLRNDNLPIYAGLSRVKVLKDELRHELNEREFKVRVTAANRGQLHELGVIDDDTEIGEEVLIKLKYIDPVYAVTNESELIENPEFQSFKERYASEIKIVSEVVPEQDEHTRELRKRSGENKLK